MSEGVPVSMRVVQKIADRMGVDPIKLNPPLHSAIDTEALDALFQPTRGTNRAGGTVEFQYQGYTIRIDHSGEIHVTDSSPSPKGDMRSPTDSVENESAKLD